MSKIEVKPISWERDSMNPRLEFEVSGINYTNAKIPRRVVMTHIPVDAFNNINISENTSVFDNNYLKLRLSNMAVHGITADNPIFVHTKKEEAKSNMDELDIDFNAKDDTVNSSSLKQLTMYVDYINNTNEIVTVGTNDAKFYYSEKQIDSPYPVNIPIVKLQGGQRIKLSAITVLGCEEISSIYSAVSIFTYKQLADDKYHIIMESRGQLDEKTILQYAYDNIRKLLDNFLQLIPDREEINGKLQLNEGDHTLGNLISDGLKKHKKVKFAGYNSPHLLDKKIIFHYELNEKANIKHIIKETINNYMDTFETLNKLIQKNIK